MSIVAVVGVAGAAELTARVAPDGYVQTMGGVVAAMAVIFAVLVLCTAVFQYSSVMDRARLIPTPAGR